MLAAISIDESKRILGIITMTISGFAILIMMLNCKRCNANFDFTALSGVLDFKPLLMHNSLKLIIIIIITIIIKKIHLLV